MKFVGKLHIPRNTIYSSSRKSRFSLPFHGISVHSPYFRTDPPKSVPFHSIRTFSVQWTPWYNIHIPMHDLATLMARVGAERGRGRLRAFVLRHLRTQTYEADRKMLMRIIGCWIFGETGRGRISTLLTAHQSPVASFAENLLRSFSRRIREIPQLSELRTSHMWIRELKSNWTS